MCQLATRYCQASELGSLRLLMWLWVELTTVPGICVLFGRGLKVLS